MSNNPHYEVAVAGLGVYGTAVLSTLASWGVRAIGIDQYNPPHDFGSSHGGSRISRFANFEGEGYVEPAMRTARMYQDLQKNPRIARYLKERFGDGRLFHPNGTAIMGPAHAFNKEAHGTKSPIHKTLAVAQTTAIRYELISGKAIHNRLPHMTIPDDELKNTIVYLEQDSGTLFPERCVAAQLYASRLSGADILIDTRITGIDQDGANVKTISLAGGGKITADKVVICAGPWVKDFLPEDVQRNFTIQRQVFGWFKTNDPQGFSMENYPNYIRFVTVDDGKVDYFYGFPADSEGLVKVARENGVLIGGPDDPATRQTWESEVDSLYAFTAPRIKGLQREFAKSIACRYTIGPNHQFSIGPHPELLDTWVVSACSGHGFKHAAALGAAIANAVMDKAGLENINLADFGWDTTNRFSKILKKLTL